MDNIQSAIQFIVGIENLRSKRDLDIWCGDMGKKSYIYMFNGYPLNIGKE